MSRPVESLYSRAQRRLVEDFTSATDALIRALISYEEQPTELLAARTSELAEQRDALQVRMEALDGLAFVERTGSDD